MRNPNRLGRTLRFVPAGVVLAGVAAVALAAATRGARSKLDVPDPAPDDNAKGNLSVKQFADSGRRPGRSWIRVRARHLDRKTGYTLWLDDPSTEGDNTTVQFGAFTTNGGGNVNYRLDTMPHGRERSSDALPFGSSIDGLAGMAFEIKDGDGAVVLQGTFPDITPE